MPAVVLVSAQYRTFAAARVVVGGCGAPVVSLQRQRTSGDASVIGILRASAAVRAACAGRCDRVRW